MSDTTSNLPSSYSWLSFLFYFCLRHECLISNFYVSYFLTYGDVAAVIPVNLNNYLENMKQKHFVPRPFLRISFVYYVFTVVKDGLHADISRP